MRIEVGYGLEAVVPDAIASRVINEVLAPRIQAGHPDDAVTAAIDTLTEVIGGQADAPPPKRTSAQSKPLTLFQWISYSIVAILILAFAITHPALAFYFLASIMSGGSGGGRGGGGGGTVWWRRSERIMVAIDKDRIKQAIQRAEMRTSGEIRVSVSPLFWGDVRKAAEKAFERLGMTATKDRNAVLFFVVPARRKFVVLGDSGIHEKVGQEFWHHIVGTVSERFKQGDFTGGLVAGIEMIGEDLAKHFPYQAASDTNELADDVDRGPGG